MGEEKATGFYCKCKSHLSSFFDKTDGFFDKPKSKRICFGLVFLLSFLLIYLYNALHPLFGDDWEYSMMPDGQAHINSFSDIFDSLYDHYFLWGGRIVVHFIAETLLFIDIHLAKTLNSLAFVSLMLVIYKIANQKNKMQPSLLLAIGLLLFLLQPAFASTTLWVTGSSNYLWGTLIILCFLYLYCSHLFNPDKDNSAVKSIILFFGGIIAGWTNENMAVALVFMAIVFILYYKFKTGKIPLWAITGLIGATTGMIFMLAAPGNYVRMEDIRIEQIEAKRELPLVAAYVKQFLRAVLNYFQYALLPTFIYVITLYLYRLYGRKGNNAPQIKFLSYLFMVAAIVATLSMSASPIFPPRAMFGIICLIMLATGVLYANIDFSNTFIKKLNYIILGFGVLFFMTDYLKGYGILKEVNSAMNFRIEKVKEGKEKGQQDFVFDNRIENPDRRYVHFYEFSTEPNEWPNDEFSAYYDIHSISVK